jgi:hypothetical protein
MVARTKSSQASFEHSDSASTEPPLAQSAVSPPQADQAARVSLVTSTTVCLDAETAEKPPVVDLTALSETIARQLQLCLSDTAIGTGGDCDITAADSSTPTNRRRSYRCAVIPQGTAILKFGKQRFTAGILDESAEGACVSIDGAIECEVGQTALLQIASAWMEVRVMNVQREPCDESPQGENRETHTRLGLLRLKDIEVPDDELQWEPLTWTDVQALFMPLWPLTKFVVSVVGLLVMGLAIAVTLVWLLSDPTPITDAASRALKSKGSGTTRANPPETRGPNADAAPPLLRWPRERPRYSSKPKVTHALSSDQPSLLFHPEAIRRLALSADQLDRLHAILDEVGGATDQAIVARLKSPSTEPPLDWADRKAQRALDTLSDEQREGLTGLLTDPAFARARGATATPATPTK